jgi:hypothetical protein
MGRPRHALPSGRRELDRAYRALLAEAAAQRAETAQARLEVTRLLTLTEGLTALVTRLSGELSEARRALDRRPDEGRAEALAAQVADLRATVVLQQSLLADLTRSVAEALRAPAPAPAAPPVPQVVPVDASSGMPPAPVAPAVTTVPVAHADPVAATRDGDQPGHQATPEDAAAAVPAPAQVSEPATEPATELMSEPVSESGSEQAGGAGPVEDETVLRLRLIRQAFEG